MSAPKFEQFSYKLFDPGFHSQRPIIVDEELESPDTVTLAYEEEAASGANGGGLSMSMSAYKPQPSQVHGFVESPYSQFSPQSFSSHPTDHATPQQINNIAFSSNNATAPAQYEASSPADDSPAGSVLAVLSGHPMVGPSGTRVMFKVSSQLDLTTCADYIYATFGSQKCEVDVRKSGMSCEDGSAWIFSITAVAPQFMLTNCASPANVPLTLYVDDGTDGMARVVSGGTFTYHLDDAHAHSGPLSSSVGATGDLGQQREGARHKTGPHAHVDAHSTPATPTAEPQPQQMHQDQQHQDHQQQQQNHQLPHPPHLAVRTSDIASPVQHQHHDHHQPHQQDQLHAHGISSDTTTNTYPYTPVSGIPVAETQIPTDAPHMQTDDDANNAAAATAYNQGSEDMLGSYRSRVSFGDQYRPPTLRQSSGAWSAYGSQDASERYDIVREAALAHSQGSMMRQAATLSPRASHHAEPGSSNLTRTSILAASAQSHGYGNGIYSTGWAGAAPPPRKAELIMRPDELNSMADINSWTQEEWANKRRIVMFTKKQTGSQLAAYCKPVPVGDRPPNAICISCIWWAERKDCFVTSVDAIYLLERLIVPPRNNKFDVEEKNRIRRNLEGNKPITVSKNRRDTEDFFKVIMGFGNPKPRNIEKDIKVFSWKVLETALRKIVSKYSYSPPSVLPAHHPAPAPTHHLVTPVSLPALPAVTYPGLPPTPVSATTATDPSMAAGYVSIATAHGHHHNHMDHGLPSPRSLPPSSSWAASYPTSSTRTISPGLGKPSSSPGSGLRISTLSSSIYDTRSPSHSTRSAGGAYGLHASPHHHIGHGGAVGAGRYDPYDVTISSYASTSHTDPYSTHAAGGHHGHSVYGTHGGYAGDGSTHRA